MKVNVIKSRNTGGKAGKGYNKTTSFQVVSYSDNGYTVHKIFRYRIDNEDSRRKALDKAVHYKHQIERGIQCKE